VANLSSNDLKNLLSSNKNSQEGFKETTSETSSSEVVENVLSDGIDAIRNYNAKKLETILLNVSTKLTQPRLIEDVIVPLVYKVGELWHSGEIRVANEHLGSSVIRGFLFNLLESYSVSDSAPIVVSATPRGQEHELGALIAGVVAASSGWKVIYLGSNLPAEEISAVVGHLKARVVALSIVYPNDDPVLPRELRKIKQSLPPGVSIVAGGRAADGYLDVLDEISAVVVKNTKQFRIELETIRENKYN